MDGIRAAKAELRRTMRAVRADVADHLLRSVQLWAAVAELAEYQRAATVMAFVGVRGEPDTDPLFARLGVDGKRLLLPRVTSAGLVACDGSGPLVKSSFGVPEPQGELVDVSEIDVVLVPGLAFTTTGDRLGYGGGFYDRFLPTVSAPTIGVCFAEQLVDELPRSPDDVRVQQVIGG
jgi:5-formyltetrahydrofolate cyclo-ligase